MLLNREEPLSRRCGRVWNITVTVAVVALVVSVATISLTHVATALRTEFDPFESSVTLVKA